MQLSEYEISPDEAYIRDAIKRGVASIRDVPMKAIGRPDIAYQARVKHLDNDHVERLSHIFDEQGIIGPVVVFSAGDRMILADGFHRHEVHRIRQLLMIRAYVVEVTPDCIEREARLFASMCNRNLSLGRTSQDIRKAVEMLFSDPECWEWTDRRIGEHCGTTGNTVKLHRARYAEQHRLALPKVTIASDGKSRRYGDKGGVSRGSRKGKKDSFRASRGGKSIYLGSDEEGSKLAVVALAKEDERRRRVLKLSVIREFLLSRRIFLERVDSKSYDLHGLGGLHGRGIVMTSTDLRTHDALTAAIGRLRLLRHHLGALDARIVVVCYKEDGPHTLIELAERDGVEFLTPEQLAESLTHTLPWQEKSDAASDRDPALLCRPGLADSGEEDRLGPP